MKVHQEKSEYSSYTENFELKVEIEEQKPESSNCWNQTTNLSAKSEIEQIAVLLQFANMKCSVKEIRIIMLLQFKRNVKVEQQKSESSSFFFKYELNVESWTTKANCSFTSKCEMFS